MENLIYESSDLSASFVERITVLIEEKKFSELKTVLMDVQAPDVAEILDECDPKKRTVIFRLLSKEHAAEVFAHLEPESQCQLIESFTDAELSAVLSELYIDDTVDIIEEMPAFIVKRIIKAANRDDREVINAILRYPKDSAGSVMTTEYVRFVGNITVEEALAHLRRVAIDKETIYTCYVTDAQRHIIGIVTAKELLISSLDRRIFDIMNEAVICANTHDPREQVARSLEKYGFLAMPVVDNEHRLVGIVTLDDAIDVLSEEFEEDVAKMAAITPTETPYLKTSVLDIFKSRVPWLLILMISSTLSSAILTGFESVLPAVLVLFVPMIMGTGGNSGGQSSVTVTRSISLAELEFSDVWRVFFKEFRVGILCGVSVGAAAFLKVVLVDMLLMNNPAVSVWVALTVAVSLAFTIIAAKLVGAVLPIAAKRIGLDPAVMASPLITTLVDALSLIVYFFVAKGVLNI